MIVALAGCGEVAAPAQSGVRIAVGATQLGLGAGDTSRVGVYLMRGSDVTLLYSTDTVPIGLPPVSWSSSDTSVAVVTSGGLVMARAFGRAVLTATAMGTRDTATVVVDPEGAAAPFTAVAAGDGFTCALDVAGAAFCWGANEFGELGGGTTRRYTATLAPVRVRTTERFRTLSVGASHACAVTLDSGVACWGWNASAQLGDGSRLNRAAPTRVGNGSPYAAVSAGAFHTCALRSNGAAYCWGDNRYGQLGPDSSSAANMPRAVGGDLSFVAISAGVLHTCGVTSDGAAYCWGDNRAGQLGISQENGAGSATPTRVAGTVAFAAVSAGDRHTCGLARGGALYCWGSNEVGQLGTGDAVGRDEPTLVAGGLAFRTVDSGGNHTCAVAVGGTLYCWGGNERGQVGDGAALGQPVPPGGTPNPYIVTAPVVVATDLRFESVNASGEAHTCAVAVGGGTHCWGGNASGALGAGRLTFVSGAQTPFVPAPVPVRAPLDL